MNKWEYHALYYEKVVLRSELENHGIPKKDLDSWLERWSWLDLIKIGNETNAMMPEEARLNQMGIDGWDCFQFLPYTNSVVYYFKRPVSN